MNRIERYSLATGGLTLEWPDTLTVQDLADIAAWLELVQVQMRRAAERNAAATLTGPTGSASYGPNWPADTATAANMAARLEKVLPPHPTGLGSTFRKHSFLLTCPCPQCRATAAAAIENAKPAGEALVAKFLPPVIVEDDHGVFEAMNDRTPDELPEVDPF